MTEIRMTEIRTWPDAILPYVEGDDLPQRTRESLRRAIDTWNDSAALLKIRPRTEESSYVTFRPGRLSESPRGRLGEKEQVISLAPNTRYGVIMHEIGHAIGLTHEHNRPDRDDYIKVVIPNIRTEMLSQFQPRDEPPPEDDYDLESIMHYSQMAFSRNNQPTIRILGALPRGVLVGQRRRLSDGDIRRIENLYGPTAPSKKGTLT